VEELQKFRYNNTITEGANSMKQAISKNQMGRYHGFLHEVCRDKENLFYCRAMNAVTDIDYYCCKECPLAREMYQDDGGRMHPTCWYFDFTMGYANNLPPVEQKKRMGALIQAGFTEEFPEYLDPADKTHAIVEKAIRYAANAHHGSFRKGNHLPYIIHPMECMMLTARMTDDVDVIAAAALHDVVEDTPKTLLDLEQEFGSRVAGLVAMESEDKREGQDKGDTWKVRKQENLKREETASKEAKMIMLADKVSNMRATYRDFLISGDAIWEKFNMKDIREQEWYYRSVAEVLSELSDFPIYQEYVRILDVVFHKSKG